MNNLKQNEVWFLTGSQHLYGEETLRQVAEHSQIIAKELNESQGISVSIIYKPTVKTTEEIYAVCQEANQNKNCIGIIAWMHTFSPAKMWIGGLKILQKPMLHLHTQFNRDIPWESIDMDFMNLNQSAHGDREFGFMVSRMKIERKVVVGHWQDPKVKSQIDTWARAASGWNDWQGAKFARFGDNMRNVAVTEGDKVEAELKFGFAVNTFAVGDLVQLINAAPESEIKGLVEEYEATYTLADNLKANGARRSSLLDAAQIEIGMRKFLKEGGFKGFTNTFEDLHGMKQLPGIATQRLMAEGYGYAGEGDWKTAALVRAMKVMGTGLEGGNAFMEDYTYHFDPSNSMVLGAHMLEVDPVLANGKPTCEVHPLGIGGKEDPVRLVFNGKAGASLNASLVDMGNRFRLVVNEVEAVEVPQALPKLPVARVMWKPLPDMNTGCAGWIYAGGAHHTCFSQSLTTEHLTDFAKIAGLENIIIDKETNLRQLQNEVKWSDAFYRLGF
ncbi:L-arabinose isomerase [Belliella baltica DSM 15883]|uniref:L-arabinose isomerase n=1 Tax=Belliella baltica (strain DSM 15883 / CIP 108006 / LMG 21964 / BA134) TaxID=866536 RepID=I3Z536_BELBD|nr:L-arabinose isomerase [Belliella baltica]AFL84354.1 L-arabinose isomerase [Belliella baltica DSM 15883]